MVYSQVNIGCQSRHIYMCHLKFEVLLQPEIYRLKLSICSIFRQIFETRPARAYVCHDVRSGQRKHRGLFFADKVLIL